jgi:UPF0755 protein
MLVRSFKKLLFFCAAGVLAASLFFGYQFNQFQHRPLNLQQETIFSIQPGSSIRRIAHQLTDAGYIDDPVMFIALARIEDQETSIKAGEFLLKPGLTPFDLVNLFAEGSSIMYGLTLIEGWNFRQVLQAVRNDPVLVQTLPQDPGQVMAALGLDGEHPEGRFLPDTYHFPRGTSDRDFLLRAYRTMERRLQQAWAKRAPDLPLKTPYEALTLASIIEKETGVAHERPLIAGVFIERLKRGMRLQTDPTIIYGLGESFDGNIRFRDLKKDTPYNTYIHKGLTPTPIAMPGIDAIHAALNPAETDAIFFVSKGDGTHHFSVTLEEHNAAVSKYQLKGRKPKRKPEAG